jgi:protein-disulfide isomerase
MQSLIFDNQDLISTENVWDKLAEFAAQSGLDANSMKICMSSAGKACTLSAAAKAAIDSDHRDGKALNIDRTPTAYVSGPVLRQRPPKPRRCCNPQNPE